MSIDFSTLQGLAIPEGVVTEIKDASGRVIWAVSGGKVILQVEKITSDTYAGETTYTGEQFILLDIYPKTNGTVTVTYGGLTKTITDTSGAAEPNAQQVFFGTFNGVSDSVTTPVSGELTIKGDYYAFATGSYNTGGKFNFLFNYSGVVKIDSLGDVKEVVDDAFKGNASLNSVVFHQGLKVIGEYAFGRTALTSITLPDGLLSIGKDAFWSVNWDTDALTAVVTDVVLPSTLTSIGSENFAGNVVVDDKTADVACYLKTLTVLATTPPTVIMDTNDKPFGNPSYQNTKIIVPKGCSNVYKTATGWSAYADCITEAS